MKNEKIFATIFFGIIAAVHIMHPTNCPGYDLMTSLFHFVIMWFFFRAGVYFQRTYSTNIARTVSLAAKRNLFPFAIIGVPCFVYDIINNIYSTPDQTIISSLRESTEHLFLAGSPSCNPPLTFFVTMFCVHIIFRILVKYRIHAIALLLPLLDWVLQKEEISIPIINSLIFGTFYYCCGYIFQQFEFLRRLTGKFCAIFVYTYLICKHDKIEYINNEEGLTLHGNIINYIYTLAAIITYRSLMYWLPYIKIKWIPRHLGITILSIHFPIILFVKAYLDRDLFATLTGTCLTIGLTFILSVIISYTWDLCHKTPLLEGKLKL